MNQEQKKYLKIRLADAARAQKDKCPKRPAEPAAVKAARKIVRAYDSKEYGWGTGYRTRVEKAAAKVREIILFGTDVNALKAVKTFEQKHF